MEWLDKAMAQIGWDENLRERLRREHGIVMSRDELADKLGVKVDMLEKKAGNRTEENEVIGKAGYGEREGYTTRISTTTLEDESPYSIAVNIGGLSRAQSGDWSDLDGYKHSGYANPRAQYEWEQRRNAGVVKPLPGTDNTAGQIFNFRRISESPDMYTLSSVETYTLDPQPTGRPMAYKQERNFFKPEDIEAQQEAMNGMSDALEASRTAQPLPSTALPGLTSRTEEAEELETPKADRTRKLEPDHISTPRPF